MSDLEARYGTTSRRRRMVALVLITLLAVSSIGFVGWAAILQSSPQVQSRLTFFAFPSENLAVARMTVVRDTQSTIATCELTAYSSDHTVVGTTEITVTTGATTQVIEVQIPTERRATSVGTDGCLSPGQSRPR